MTNPNNDEDNVTRTGTDDENPVSPGSEIREDGSAPEKVFFDSTMTKFDEDGRRVLTDYVDPNEHLVQNKRQTSEDIAGDFTGQGDAYGKGSEENRSGAEQKQEASNKSSAVDEAKSDDSDNN
jgi:hypothetical protein